LAEKGWTTDGRGGEEEEGSFLGGILHPSRNLPNVVKRCEKH